MHVSYQGLQHASTLLLMLPDQHDIINVMNQYDVLQCVQMVQMSSSKIMTDGRRVNMALEQSVSDLLS